MNHLTTLLTSLQSSLIKTIQEQNQVKDEMGIAQAEVRQLRRLVESVAGEGGHLNKGGGEREWFDEHPLGHLLDLE